MKGKRRGKRGWRCRRPYTFPVPCQDVPPLSVVFTGTLNWHRYTRSGQMEIPLALALQELVPGPVRVHIHTTDGFPPPTAHGWEHSWKLRSSTFWEARFDALCAEEPAGPMRRLFTAPTGQELVAKLISYYTGEPLAEVVERVQAALLLQVLAAAAEPVSGPLGRLR